MGPCCAVTARSLIPRNARFSMPLNSHHRRRLELAIVSGLTLIACILPAQARAAAHTKAVSYHGYRLVIPASWPVYRLQTDRTACVRFDRHAVYLGQPSGSQQCPASAAGRTEAILVQQLHGSSSAVGAQPLPVPAPGTTGGGGTAARIVSHTHQVIVTATWNRQPGLIKRALGVRSLSMAARASATRSAPSSVARADALMHSYARAHTSSVSAPGQVYTGSGFDACNTPSSSQMAAWGSSPYRALGVYIGGTNMACSQPNLNATWVSQQSAAGWHLIPIYVGLQAPSNSCGCAAISPASASSEGAAAASDAMADAQTIGLGAGNPLYLDMESYSRTSTNTTAVLAFIQGWTDQLHAGGYRSGVYSGDNSGIVDLVNRYGTGYAEPDDIWIANWNSAQTTSDSNVPAAEWAAHQRMHQYDGGHNERYGGVTINIDGDYIDASTAAAGTGSGVYATPTPAPTPALRVSPAANGAVNLMPSWLYATGVTGWQLLAGQSPAALAPLGAPVGAHARMPVVSQSTYPYYAVTALGAGAQPLGTSPAVATAAHMAIFGQSAFIPRIGFGGVPVGCFNATPCTGVTVTLSLGTRTLVKTGPQRIPVGGGLAYFSLTPAQRIQLWHAPRHQESVTIAVRSSSGLHTSRQLTLTSFSTTGRSPSRSVSQSSALRLVGTTDFVSNGWVGGILADCMSATPCLATTKIVAHGTVIAQTHALTLGVGQLGYLMFTLTAAGHQLLTHTVGNQMPATVTVVTGGTATGHLVLSAYN
jgi:Rv2525c-like, glycoside hydrolase-like domain